MKKRFGSIVMALLLVLSISANAMAASDVPASLRLSGEEQSGQTTVQAFLTAEGATNGKLSISYDESLVTLVSAVAADSGWIVSLNDEEAGLVSFAWVGSELPAEESQMLTLVFDAVGDTSGAVIYAGEVTELYAGDTALNIDSASDSVTVGSSQGAGNAPVVPSPTPPAPDIPTQPEDSDTPGTDEPGTEPEVQCPFTDIDDHWSEEYIVAAWKAGLVNGTTETTYSPNAPLTRGMFATLLYRLAGSPEVTAENPFADVADDMYYADPIIWAYNNGVVKGVSDTQFRPNSNITRQELVTMLQRYAVLTGDYMDSSVNLSDFSDAADVASWAQKAMEWAVAEGIVIGTGNQLMPKVNTNRAETATILVRYAGL